MKSLSSILAISLLTLLSGCYANIDLDKYRTESNDEMLVINAAICADSAVAVSATHLTYYENIDYGTYDYCHNFTPIDTLHLQLRINGVDCGAMAYVAAKNIYVSSATPKHGDVVEISTNYRNSAVCAIDSVPMLTPIESIRFEKEDDTSSDDAIITYYITFTDNPDASNYYYLSFDSYDPMTQHGFDYSYEYVFSQLSNLISDGNPAGDPVSIYGLPFTDKGIEGQTHTLIIRQKISDFNRLSLFYDSLIQKVKLYTISEAYYKYQLCVLKANGQNQSLTGTLIDLGLASPTMIYSNVEGGVGLFGCFAPASATIDLLQGAAQ